MAALKILFRNFLIFALCFTQVRPWTIDLPEIRKIVFDKNDHSNDIKNDKSDDKIEIKGQFYYSNREGNSLHNSKHYEDVYKNNPYAREYGYQSYMEKKVHNIVYNGSRYLDGLQRSLEKYTKMLEDCHRMNRTNSTWRPPHESPLPNVTLSSCADVTRASEHVRRLAQLAMWTTRELQDIAYSRKYKKGDPYDLSQQENELILKLAWFLDRLAHFTGYEPRRKDIKGHEEEGERPTTTPPPTTLPPLMNAPEPVKRLMMECLKMNSSEPAVVRCAYPEAIPPIARLLLNYSDEEARRMFSPISPSSSNINEQVLPISFSEQITPSDGNEELLIASDFNPTRILQPFKKKSVQKRAILSLPKPDMTKLPPHTAVKVKKRAKMTKEKLSKMPIMSAIKIKKRFFKLKPLTKKIKRSVDENPAYNFLKYFAKTKAWLNDNIDNYKIVDTDSVLNEYEVKNQLDEHLISKRSIERPLIKKYDHFRHPDNPFQDLSKYIKHKKGVNYIKDEEQAAKIKKTLEKMHNKTLTLTGGKSLSKPRKMAAVSRPKRSVKFEQDVDKPRDSEDPQQDISYYVKNKKGTNINPNILQAGQVRAGLEQVFLTPNIEVVRRYGANYNPLIPAPFYFGIMRSMADNI